MTHPIEGRTHIHDQQFDLGVGTGRPGTPTRVGSGDTQPRQPVRVAADALDDPPRGRRLGDLAEQLGLVAQHPRVAQTVPPSASITASPAARARPGIAHAYQGGYASPAPWSTRACRPAQILLRSLNPV
jgi:hypothetical protein